MSGIFVDFTSKEEGFWGPYQPPDTTTGQCVKIEDNPASYYKKTWVYDDCQIKLPFVCEAKACLEGMVERDLCLIKQI